MKASAEAAAFSPPAVRAGAGMVWPRVLLVALIGFLVVALALPLFSMLSQAFTVWRFDLAAWEFQVDKGEGWSKPMSALALNKKSGAIPAEDLEASSDARLAATRLFADFSFRSKTRYRIRNSKPRARFIFGSDHITDADWHEFSSNQFRRVFLRPQSHRGVDNFRRYIGNPALASSIFNSLFIAAVSTLVTVPLAFGFAYVMTRLAIPLRGAFRLVALIPILVPSLLPGIALVYLFGNQGVLKGLLMGHSIYGPVGIVIGSVFFTFPHAFLILNTALSLADSRLYEAAAAFGARNWRTFFTVTLPGARYGLVSAALVVFTLVITDFGLPKVIGGSYNVLAVDVYKQVIGQQNFEMGAVVALVLLLPAVLTFVIERIVQRRQTAQVAGQAAPLQPGGTPRARLAGMVYALLVSLFIFAIIGMCQYAALVKLWPYNLSLSLDNYNFDQMDGGGWGSWFNSLRMASLTALFGTMVVFVGAWLVEKMRGLRLLRGVYHGMAMLPMAVPGLVLGLSYIFFFNNPANPLRFLYGTMAILVISAIVHFFTVGHLTAMTSLKQLDPEFEEVAASLKVPLWRLFFKVTAPVSLPAILDIAIYLFVNAMTTVSAVVFLYSPDTMLASVAVLNMDDAGDIAPAAAMGMMIFYTCAMARMLHLAVSRVILGRTQAWRLR